MLPFRIAVSDDLLDDLRRRLSRTRWLDQMDAPAWSYGPDVEYLRRLVLYWQHGYDWRRFEATLNALPNYSTVIDGQPIHFIHARSPIADALPLLITHGWPSSITEFLSILGPLSDPVTYGGSARDAFHVVCPSLPGFGWSGPIREPGWDVARTARAWGALMDRLGYPSFGAHGGDWGSAVSGLLAETFPERLIGIHLNVVMTPFPSRLDVRRAARDAEPFVIQPKDAFGFSVLQRTAPQTLAYSINDSPAGLAAWILDRFHAWSDCNGDLAAYFEPDTLLGNIMTYWVTGTAGSAARLYFETRRSGRRCPSRFVEVPTGVAVFPRETYQTPRWFAERYYNVVRWTPMPAGGHFPALEQPELLVDDIRAHFRPLRTGHHSTDNGAHNVELLS